MRKKSSAQKNIFFGRVFFVKIQLIYCSKRVQNIIYFTDFQMLTKDHILAPGDTSGDTYYSKNDDILRYLSNSDSGFSGMKKPREAFIYGLLRGFELGRGTRT